MMDRGQIENYTLQSRLGSGAFAQVFKAIHKTSGNVVAIKMIDVYRLTERNSKLKENLNYEIRILKSVNHPNIVTLYDVLDSPPPSDSYIYMIMECCEGGDFSKYIRKHKKLSEDRALDLKPQNLLLSDSSDTPILKIADFGFARFIDVQSLSDTFCGSPLYMAPEILHRKNYTVKADLWSVGVILYEMLIGEPPYNCNTVVDLLHQLETTRIKLPSNVSISRECQDLLYSLLQTNEANRISWEDFFLHPWLGFSQNIPIALSPTSATNYINSASPFIDNNALYHHNSSSNSATTGIYSPSKPDRIVGQQQQQHNQFNINDGQQQPKKNTTSSSSIDFEKDCVILDDEESINTLERIGKRAVAIAELGDLRQFEPSECVPLYLKALLLIKSRLQGSTPNFSFGSPNLYRYNAVTEKLRESLREYLDKTLKHYARGLEPSQTFSPNKFIYDTALEMGRNGGVEEMYKDYPKSLQYYTDGLLLLEYLLSISVDKEDQGVLSKYINSFNERIQYCTQLSSR
ncbi:hypothetical protein SAMD00019534_101650 [Acytostelium subglobosum LB1]|uniref:hypothetical protein n=1 Tax=Acytostelium subglobosum LB1 TaxID=1410327 RepID=UPI0006448C10|nr:hypothetical protein SAMD00019534_101650 [Acytostelium subglobosum LB1]GAM26990.1 hypothetical protein SAMD00019534_101650 [Acytostelium subglobosum LB1]|eukprot:XP_012749870.1 hypothetical protein SAMD00019534_101650 [Acytostelium subglobosum LB1]